MFVEDDRVNQWILSSLLFSSEVIPVQQLLWASRDTTLATFRNLSRQRGLLPSLYVARVNLLPGPVREALLAVLCHPDRACPIRLVFSGPEGRKSSTSCPRRGPWTCSTRATFANTCMRARW